MRINGLLASETSRGLAPPGAATDSVGEIIGASCWVMCVTLSQDSFALKMLA
jgi:hypothetical protein